MHSRHDRSVPWSHLCIQGPPIPVLCPPRAGGEGHPGRHAVQPASTTGVWLNSFNPMQPACSCHTSLLSTYCVQLCVASHPPRCWPALSNSPSLGEKQMVPPPTAPGGKEANLFHCLPHAPSSSTSPPGDRCTGLSNSPMQVRLTFPLGGNNSKAKPRP